MLSQHCCMADINEAYEGSLALQAVQLRAPTVWVWGHVYPALLPRFSYPPRVRHSYAVN
jgi:uncharacterized membrane protein (UPF0182 family)